MATCRFLGQLLIELHSKGFVSHNILISVFFYMDAPAATRIKPFHSLLYRHTSGREDESLQPELTHPSIRTFT